MTRQISLRPEKYLGHVVHLLTFPDDHPRNDEYKSKLAEYRALWNICTEAERAEAVAQLIEQAELRYGGRMEYTDEAINAAQAFLNGKEKGK